MPAARPTRLNEAKPSPLAGKTVIDAQFKVVGRQTMAAKALRFLVALAIAALIGFIAPPLWILAQQILGAFRSPQ